MTSETHVKFASGIHPETPATNHSQTHIKSDYTTQLAQNVGPRVHKNKNMDIYVRLVHIISIINKLNVINKGRNKESCSQIIHTQFPTKPTDIPADPSIFLL
jgi:hypothetical protein